MNLDTQNKKTSLQRANIAFNAGDYELAIKLYEKASIYPLLAKSLQVNIRIASSRLKKNLKQQKKSATPNFLLTKPDSLDGYYFDKIVESGLFDVGYYAATYRHLVTAETNLLEHYLNQGIEQSLNPSPGFNTAYYLKYNQDVAKAEINPFIHYVCNGKAEGREAAPKPYASKYSVAPVEYIPRLTTDISPVTKAVRTICFYLPQYHAIPENDEWWGKGFTEWTNVKPATPQFAGHYQPHVPHEDIGYYNLLNRDAQAKQLELAKQYGIEGFCYYLYWFSGQRLLEKPLDNMLADPTLDFPFCVCWANENWSRRWDGLDQDLLMVQNYSDEDDIAFISNIAKYLRDPRYITIDGKPLLLVYRPNLFPDMKTTAKRWRTWCRNNSIGEIYLVYPQSFECVDPAEYDFDAAVEFPPNNSNPPSITPLVDSIVDDFQTNVYDWRAFVERSDEYVDPGYKLFRSVTPSWDNTARKKNKGTVFHNSCPKLFQKYLTNAYQETIHCQHNHAERLVFINAWNEWAEGAHLEPDQKYGYAWLQAVRNAHEDAAKYIANFCNSTALIRPDEIDDETFNIIKETRLFEPSWYIQQYGKTHTIIGNPLRHYLNYGIFNNLNPSQNFNTSHYLQANPDVKQAGVNPFIHYVMNGRHEGRQALPLPPIYNVLAPEYIPRLDRSEHVSKKAVKVICFYLPQFHAIPENDAWWGEGFTEWTNVKPASAQFEGHYQPHVPDDFLGYYNLLETETQLKQIELAKQYGVEGFCYYFYWFSSNRLLEKPLDRMFSNKNIDFPFCLCWANENWSRRWDGHDSELLITQEYSDDDDIAFIKEVSKYFDDSRYIRINEKPLLLIYRPTLFPDINKTVESWRRWCRDNGVGEIYLAYPQSFSNDSPETFSFDAAIEFPPSGWYTRQEFATDINPIVDDFESSVYDWRAMLHASQNYIIPEYKLFRGLTPSWDNTARRKSKGTVFHNSCPSLFYKWLVNAFDDTLNRIGDDDEQLVFVNAWNEWAEGAHLEPDQRYGYAWLQAIKNAHEFVLKKRTRIIVVGHDAYTHGAQILLKNMIKVYKEQFHFDVDVIVLGEGPLLATYSEYATVHQIDLSSTPTDLIISKIEKIRSKGAEIAIVNTTISGGITHHLKAAGVKIVSLIHELPGILSNYALEHQAQLIAANADKVVFPAHQVQQGFEEFIGSSLPQAIIRPQGMYLPSILRQGISKTVIAAEVRAELGLASDAKIIMCAGYADHRKGFDYFVQSSMEVMKQIPDAYALWVGHLHTPFVEKSMQVAINAGFEDKFIFTGLVEDPRKYYAAADIYALTSREDPFPSVVMEALDALTPVVAFKDCGGFENLLSRNCGVLVAKDDVHAYATAVVNILNQPTQARALAETGKAIIEQEFSFHHYLFDLLQLAEFKVPKVSVVVPNYNYAKYIVSRLESITNQNFPLYELIVLDDNSSDNSIEVIRKFLTGCKIPYRLIPNQHNSGSVFKQWQKAAELVQGDYLWIAEADDLAEPDFVERLIAFFEDPDVVLAYSQSKQIDQDGNLLANDYLGYTNDIGEHWIDDYVVSGEDEIKRALCIKNTIPNVSGVIVRTDAFLKAITALSETLTKYKVAGDWLVYLEIIKSGKVAFCSKSLNHHRRHTSSVTKINNHFDEVVDAQNLASSMFDIDDITQAKVTSYRAFLVDYFSN
jgi:lipopolysaccharide biosynthesis protein/GT2 family glycosyltransferase